LPYPGRSYGRERRKVAAAIGFWKRRPEESHSVDVGNFLGTKMWYVDREIQKAAKAWKMMSINPIESCQEGLRNVCLYKRGKRSERCCAPMYL
jgi:hypothetical protein